MPENDKLTLLARWWIQLAGSYDRKSWLVGARGLSEYFSEIQSLDSKTARAMLSPEQKLYDSFHKDYCCSKNGRRRSKIDSELRNCLVSNHEIDFDLKQIYSRFAIQILKKSYKIDYADAVLLLDELEYEIEQFRDYYSTLLLNPDLKICLSILKNKEAILNHLHQSFESIASS